MIQLCEQNECTGCGACMNICPKHAITMKADAEGFLFPEIDASLCIECKLCQKACHVLHPLKKNEKAEKPFAVVAKEVSICEKSSSGGMFSILAQKILSHGGVVFGAGYHDGYQLSHIKAENEQDLASLRGSKYFQSDIKVTYKEVRALLKQNREVLFTGTPCQIAGLYAYLGKSNTEGLYTADLVCHGVPSPKSFNIYIQRLAEKENCKVENIKNFSFRDLKGWDIVPSFQISEGKQITFPLSKNLYMQLFLNSYLHRECCYQCKYTTPERIGDITLADFWGIGAEKPFNYDTRKGCSLVLINSEKGKELFHSVVDSLNYDVREWSEALAQNHQLRMSSVRPKKRGEVYSYWETHTNEEVYQHFFNTPMLRFKRLVGGVLSTLHLR